MPSFYPYSGNKSDEIEVYPLYLEEKQKRYLQAGIF